MQLLQALPSPLQEPPAFHPDGPLQQRARFNGDDLEDEHQMLRQLWMLLRRGDLNGALEFCANSGQAWRTALLQGMLPFADSADEPVGYDIMEEDDEDLLVKLKQEHTDWTELGTLEGSATNNGNPRRRLWKEECWNISQRNIQSSSAMDPHELAIYGFCSGHREAMMPVCNMTWSDRCFCELHCMKEWLVEFLLDADRADWCKQPDLFLGEGDGGCADIADTPDDRAERSRKLSGRFLGVSAEKIEDTVASEIQRLFARLRSEWEGPQQEGSSVPFTQLQMTLIEAAWVPAQEDAALSMLRKWLSDGIDGVPCPFLVKQFASYFAIWQKKLPGVDATPKSSSVCRELDSGSQPNVDDIVNPLVRDLVATATGAWDEHCLEGKAVELIAEHVSAMTLEGRLDAYIDFMLELGARCRDSRDSTSVGSCAGSAPAPDPSLEMAVLKKCLWIFWCRFPEEVFALIGVLIRRVLLLADPGAQEEEICDIGPSGVRIGVQPEGIRLALLSIAAFWEVLRGKTEEKSPMLEVAFSGLRLVLGQLPASAPRDADDFSRSALELVVLPLLVDTFFSFAVKDVGGALSLLPTLQGSQLWCDAFSCGARCAESLAELEWYLILCQRQSAWAVMRAETAAQYGAVPQLVGFGPGVHVKADGSFDSRNKPEQQQSTARDSILDWARPRLAQDQPLLEPMPNTHTSLPNQQWTNMRRTIVYRAILLLLSTFEQNGDFDGAFNDLAVVVAQSPWVLQQLLPWQARTFLSRLAAIPANFDNLAITPLAA